MMVYGSHPRSTASPKPSGLPLLTRTLTQPIRVPPVVDAWRRLERIESIAVTAVDGLVAGEKIHAIDMYMRQAQNRIPTNTVRMSRACCKLHEHSHASKPELRVLRTDADLTALRRDVLASVRQFHSKYCGLCDGLAMHIYTHLFKTRDNDMGVFLVHLLTELHTKRAQCGPECEGQHELPLLIDEYLFGDASAGKTST